MPIKVFVGQLALHQHLRRDTGMVGAHLPKRAGSLHALIANQGIHQGLVKRMAHMQRTRHVGRRDQDAVTIPGVAGFE